MTTSTAPSRTSRGRGLLSFTAVTAAGIGAVGILAVVSPEEQGHYPTCPFLTLTGYYCPGCGSLRAVHALTQGDIATAWERNPLLLVVGPLLLVAWVMWGLRILGKTTWNTTRIPSVWIWVAFAAIIVFWIARNVPGWTWLSPA